jgi:hypothetical protein
MVAHGRFKGSQGEFKIAPKAPNEDQRETKGQPKALRGAQRKLKGANYIFKLPINRPSGRYLY